MSRTEKKLTALKVQSLKTPGRHSDGGGLYLNVTATGARSWVFMWKRNGKRREMGLGSLNAVSLADARQKAFDARRAVAEGGNPISMRNEERRKQQPHSFGRAVKEFLKGNETAWRNEKHRAQWRSTLETYCKGIWGLPVNEVETEQVLACLQPIWQKKAETASRLRGRIERVLDFAKVRGWRDGENPARWRGHLKAILPPRQKLQRGHHKELAFGKLPAFMERLRGLDSVSAMALQFCILTATRTGETLGARWDELDLENSVWTIPANRMKAGKEHRVPLSSAVVDILKPLQEARTSEFVFPGTKPNKALSQMSMAMVLRRLNEQVTVHGFRSTFKTWAGETTAFERETVEQAMSHTIGNAVEQAYRRGDLLEKRRRLMEAWAEYCGGGEAKGKVVRLNAG